MDGEIHQLASAMLTLTFAGVMLVVGQLFIEYQAQPFSAGSADNYGIFAAIELPLFGSFPSTAPAAGQAASASNGLSPVKQTTRPRLFLLRQRIGSSC
jgi:hypothetical protein